MNSCLHLSMLIHGLGYVYTRMVSKAARALATLKEYSYELEVIEALLSQRYWRRGKRAQWYERRAILLERYLCFDEEHKKLDRVLHQARQGVVEALADEDLGLGESSTSGDSFL